MSFLIAISAVTLCLLGSSHMVSSRVAEDHAVRQPAILKVITKPSLTTYFEGKNGADGMEFQLIQAFAKKHHYQLELILAENTDAIYSTLDQHLADIALLGRPLSISKQQRYPKTPSYMEVTSQLIYKAGEEKPKSFEDMVGKKIVVHDNEQNRKKYLLLKAYIGELEWEFTNSSTESLLSLVNKGKIDYTITDSHTFQLKRAMYTNTRAAFDLYYPEPVSIVYSRQSSADLQQALNTFVETSKTDGTIDYLRERFYGHSDEFDVNGYHSFSFLIKNRLPLYQDSIKSIARETLLDWRLLAAIAYQESHWDPEARSKTGVRGMMMLTNDTAQEMGVADRVDVAQSLRGGARYFKKVYKELPASIQEPDRTWFALAAYNVGAGHLLDALKITRFHDGNPDLWIDVKKHLPLLAKKEWHEFTRYGYARGAEPVSYVQNIRHYYDILEWHFPLQYNEKQNPESKMVVKLLDDVIQGQQSAEHDDDKPLLSGLFF